MTLVDLTINGLSPGRYWATVRETGDISEGAASTGGIWEALKNKVFGRQEPRGVFGTVDVNEKGKGNVFLDQPVAVWEMIGRSMVVSKSKEGPFRKDDPDTIVGVIARSAGVWDNDKMREGDRGSCGYVLGIWSAKRDLMSISSTPVTDIMLKFLYPARYTEYSWEAESAERWGSLSNDEGFRSAVAGAPFLGPVTDLSILVLLVLDPESAFTVTRPLLSTASD
ncbi:Superoxide dismutase Cu-Zn [Rasamsonia emersonii CBS 393.64]|uniref:Superoxide dismutase Cu-Zn n=1 Tax=Rasamsonia emersonii (strain ATCC 16479 / CBS 393.64 / IMI 116815) TaxID=1408163 RepID=A0A0F4YRT2_RASE3|nr:Superoxide dismutase Cu-Zn [Rasamsonia emersonii CBS 393.64]KKA20561.1 Superoxide dismutase Cu-Zn [Rasamsonia emersonii CBS 393.64]